ncbi:Homeobox-leucine zipper protein HOX32 [Platanthera zijinensis]|uniref:Homeobox-leucine zipper protein HOX32 n=1 Tax=Platanthera zijinensis TaxID=2320716 RepID=A0AAP0B1Y5_9ASPA
MTPKNDENINEGYKLVRNGFASAEEEIRNVIVLIQEVGLEYLLSEPTSIWKCENKEKKKKVVAVEGKSSSDFEIPGSSSSDQSDAPDTKILPKTSPETRHQSYSWLPPPPPPPLLCDDDQIAKSGCQPAQLEGIPLVAEHIIYPPPHFEDIQSIVQAMYSPPPNAQNVVCEVVEMTDAALLKEKEVQMSKKRFREQAEARPDFEKWRPTSRNIILTTWQEINTNRYDRGKWSRNPPCVNRSPPAPLDAFCSPDDENHAAAILSQCDSGGLVHPNSRSTPNFVRDEKLSSGYLIRTCEGSGSMIHIVDHLDLDAWSVSEVLRPLYELLKILAQKMTIAALQHIKRIAQEVNGDICYEEGRQPAILRTFSQRLSRGLNKATNGFPDDKWSLMGSDGVEDVTITLNLSSNKLIGPNSSSAMFSNLGIEMGFWHDLGPSSFELLNVPPSLLVQFLRDHHLEWDDFGVDSYSAVSLIVSPFAVPGMRVGNGFLGSHVNIPLTHTVENEEVLEIHYNKPSSSKHKRKEKGFIAETWNDTEEESSSSSSNEDEEEAKAKEIRLMSIDALSTHSEANQSNIEEPLSKEDQIFLDTLKLLEDLQLKNLMTTRMKIAATEIREWVFTLSTPDVDTLIGTISGNSVSLTPDVLTKIFGLLNGEEELEIDTAEFDEVLIRMGYSGDTPNKLLKKHLSADYKFLVDVVGKAKAAESLVSPTIFINASKRLTCALFRRWEKNISKPSKASSSRPSEGTRAAPATPHPADDVSIPPPPPLIQTPSTTFQHPSISHEHQPTPPASPIHISSPVHTKVHSPSPYQSPEHQQ